MLSWKVECGIWEILTRLGYVKWAKWVPAREQMVVRRTARRPRGEEELGRVVAGMKKTQEPK